MTAVANPKQGLRPFLPSDAVMLAAIFRASIEELAAEDYNEAQQDAWASAADDEKAFVARLASQLTLVATIDGSVVGFISLAGADRLDMLYVHPAVAGHGLGTMLLEAIEKLASARGGGRLVVEASDNASGFFQRHGFTAQRRNTVSCRDEWLANTTMEKKLLEQRRAE